MKKTYIAPEINVYRIDYHTSLLAGSAQGTGIKGDASSENAVLGRGNSFWDDEDYYFEDEE